MPDDKEPISLLIIDDDVALATQLKWSIPRRYNPILAHTAEEGLRLFLEKRPGLCLLDLGLPPYENTPEIGLRLLERILSERPETKVIILTGQKEKEVAVKAVTLGAFDYLFKPISEEELILALKRAEFFASLGVDYISLNARAKKPPLNTLSGIDSSHLEEGFEALKEDVKRRIIEEALRKTGNNVSRTARLLGLRRTSVYYYINKYNLRPKEE